MSNNFILETSCRTIVMRSHSLPSFHQLSTSLSLSFFLSLALSVFISLSISHPLSHTLSLSSLFSLSSLLFFTFVFFLSCIFLHLALFASLTIPFLLFHCDYFFLVLMYVRHRKYQRSSTFPLYFITASIMEINTK